MSGHEIFTSAWKAPHFWSARERLHLSLAKEKLENSEVDFVYLDVVVQGLAGRILDFLGSLFGKKTAFGQHTKARRAIQVFLSAEQCAALAKTLKEQAAQPLAQLAGALERQIYAYATARLVGNCNGAPRVSQDEEMRPDEQAADEAAGGTQTPGEQTFDHQTPDRQRHAAAGLAGRASSRAGEMDGVTVPLVSSASGDPAPLVRLDELKQAFVKLWDDERQSVNEHYEMTWLGAWYDGAHPWLAKARYAIGSATAAATDWIPGSRLLRDLAGVALTKTAEKVATANRDMVALLQDMAADDQHDLALMERMVAPVAQLAEQLDRLAPSFAAGGAGHSEFVELRQQVEATRRGLDLLHTYFEAVDALEVAVEACAEQRERLFQGKIDLAPENYLAVVARLQPFLQLKQAGQEGLNAQWQQRFEQKCRYQIEQTLHFLEDFARDLGDEMAAELAESEAQFRAVQQTIASDTVQQQPFHLEDLLALYDTYKRYQAVHRQSVRLVAQLQPLSAGQLALPEIAAALQTAHEFVQSKLLKADSSLPHPNSDMRASLTRLLQRLEKFVPPKEILWRRLKAYEAQLAEQATPLNQAELDKQLARCYRALVYAGRVAASLTLPDYDGVTPTKNARIKAKLTKALQTVGAQAKRRQEAKGLAYGFAELYRDVYRDTPAMTPLKQQLVASHQLGLDGTPAGSAKWRIFFGWLQLWDLLSPMAGLLIKPVGQRDYNYHMAMMRETAKTDPVQYAYHLQMARGVFGMHPEYEDFLTQYDAYLRGDVSYHLERVAKPGQIGGLSGEEGARPFALFGTAGAQPAEGGSLEGVPSSWWDAFMGRDAEQADWQDKSDWEKWLHYTIFPQVRDQHFDAMLTLFDSRTLEYPALDSTPEEQFSYHCYQMYQSLKYPGGAADYEMHLAQARKIYQYTPFLKEFHRYLQARSPAFSLPLGEVPLTSIPLGRTVVHQLQQETDALADLLAQAEAQKGQTAVLQQQRRLVEQQRAAVQELWRQVPLAHAGDFASKDWLKVVDAIRHQHEDGKFFIRSAILGERYQGQISAHQLQAFIHTLAKDIPLDLLAQIFGLQRVSSDPAAALAYQLEIIQARIAALQDDAFCTRQQAAEFCAEYFDNPVFAAALKDAAFLERLAAKIAQAQVLTKAFQNESAEVFSQRLRESLQSLATEDTLFFYGAAGTVVHEVIKQSHNRFTLRHYSIDPVVQKGHAQFYGGVEQKISPYLETVDVPLAAFNQQELADILKNSWSPPEMGILAQLAASLSEFFGGKQTSVKPHAYARQRAAALPTSAYQALTAMFYLPLSDEFSQRYTFEVQLKALHDFHHLHSRLYVEDRTQELVGQAATAFLAQLPVWHSRGVVHDQELNFALHIMQEIKGALSVAKIKQLTALQQAAVLPTLLGSSAPLVLREVAAELSYAAVDGTGPVSPIPAAPVYVAPLLFSYVPGGSLPQQLTDLVAHAKEGNLHGNYDNVIMAVHRFVAQIPILDQGFWQALKDSGQDPHQLICQLDELDKEYHWSLLKRPTTDPHHPLGDKLTIEDYFVQIAILKIADKLQKMKPLGKLLDKGRQHLPLFIPSFSTILDGQHPAFQPPNEAWAQRLRAIKRDWYETEPPNELSRWPEYNSDWDKMYPDWRTKLDLTAPNPSLFVPQDKLFFNSLNTPAHWSMRYCEDLKVKLFNKDYDGVPPVFNGYEFADAEPHLNYRRETIGYIIRYLAITDGTFRHQVKDKHSQIVYDKKIEVSKIGEASKSLLPPAFFKLRDLSLRTLLLLSPPAADLSREDFDKGIKQNIELVTGDVTWTKGDLYDGFPFSLEVFGHPWKWDKLHPYGDVQGLHQEPSAFSSYLYAPVVLKSLGMVNPPSEGQVRKRVAPKDLLKEVIARIEKGDKNPPELIRQLLALSSFQELQGTATVSFYTRNLHLLSDPDHQQLLKFLLLEPGVLQAEFAKHPADNQQFAETLAVFFQKSVASYASFDDMATAAFLLNLNQQVATHLASLQAERPETIRKWLKDLSKWDSFALHPAASQELARMLQLDGLSAATATRIIEAHGAWVKQCVETVTACQKDVAAAKWGVADGERTLEEQESWSGDLEFSKERFSTATWYVSYHKKVLAEVDNKLKSTQAQLETAQLTLRESERTTAYLNWEQRWYSAWTWMGAKKQAAYGDLVARLQAAQKKQRAAAEAVEALHLAVQWHNWDLKSHQPRLSSWQRRQRLEQAKQELTAGSLTVEAFKNLADYKAERAALEEVVAALKDKQLALEEAESALAAAGQELAQTQLSLFKAGFLNYASLGLDQDISENLLIAGGTLNGKLVAYKEQLRQRGRGLFPAGYTPSFLNTPHEFRRLLQRPALKPEMRALLHAQLALSYASQKNLSAAQAEELLHAVMAARLSKLPEGSLTQSAKIQLHAILREKQGVLRKLLAINPSALLNRLYQRFHPGMTALPWSGAFPRYTSLDGHIELDVVAGKLYENGGQIAYLPETIVAHPTYKQLFGNMPLPLATRLEVDTVPSQPRREVFEILGTDTKSYRLIAEAGGLNVQQLFNGHWYQLTTDKDTVWLQAQLPVPLLSGFDYWHDRHDLLLTEKGSGSMRYRVTQGAPAAAAQQIWTTDAAGAFAGQVLAEPSSVPLTAVFGRVAEAQQMLLFQAAETGAVERVELPRLGLSFTVEQQAGPPRIVCAELEGYVLAAQQAIKALGTLKNYLVLEKKTATGDDKKIVVFAGQTTAGGYLICDVDLRAQRLIPRTESGGLYLAQLYLQAHNYIKAFDRLQAYQFQTAALAKDSLAILARFAALPADAHPRALTVQLKATVMLARQRIDRAQDTIEIDSEQLLEDYICYLQQPRDERVRLSTDDERVIFRQCAHLLDGEAFPAQRLVLQRQQALGQHLTETQEIALHTATVLSAKQGGKAINFADLTTGAFFGRSHGEQPILNAQFMDLYNHIRQRGAQTDLPAFIKAAQPFFDLTANSPQTLPEVLACLDQALCAQLSGGPAEKMLASLLLKAVSDHPQSFPLNLGQLDAIQGDLHKKSWFRKEVLKPLRQLVYADASLRHYVYGLAEHMPLAATPAVSPVQEAALQYGSALAPASPFYDLPFMTLKGLSMKEIAPGDEANAQNARLKSHLDNFYGQAVQDNIARRELAALRAQNKAYFETGATLKPSYEIIDQQAFQASISALKRSSEVTSRQLPQLKEEIEALANKLPEDPVQQDLFEMRRLAGQTRPLSLEECLWLFLRRDVAQAHARNPFLTSADVHRLHQHTRAYLLTATQKQYVDYLVSLAEQEGTLAKLGAEVQRLRAYDVEAHPEYLVLEHAAGFMLTKAQVDSLDTLGIKSGVIGRLENLSKVLELIMGAGKTSMIIPLLSFLSADGRRLAITMLPKVLINSMIEGYQKQQGKAFDQMLQYIDFDRDSRCDGDSLSRLVEILETAITERRVVLMSSESQYALFLKFAETISNYLAARKHNAQVALPVEELRSFQRIFTLFKEAGLLTVDEIDLIMDVLRSFHFTIGKPRRLNELNPVIGRTLVDFYRFLHAHPELHSHMKLDGWPAATGSQPFSAEVYHQEVKPALIKAILRGECQTQSGAFERWLQGLTSAQKALLENRLTGNLTAETLAFGAGLNAELQDTLALLYEQIQTILPLMAPKNLYEHFGPEVLDDMGTTGVLPAPRQNGKPSPKGTQHGTELETIDAAIRMYQELGIPASMIKKDLAQLRQEAVEQRQAAGAIDSGETDAEQQFAVLMGGNTAYQLFSINDDELEDIVRLINARRENVFYYIEKYVIPEIKVYETELNADAQLFGILYAQIIGLTGTAWNADTLPPVIKTVIPSTTTVKTMHLLVKNSPQKVAIVASPVDGAPASVKKTVADLLAASETASSIIDTANLFRGIANEEVAKQLFLVAEEKGWNFKGVGFYAPNDEIYVVTKQHGVWTVSKLSQSGLSKNELLLIWDQSHATGSDIKLAATMTAVTTIGRHTLLRDELQAVWRLRGLADAQSVRFAMSIEEEKIIRQTLESELQQKLTEIGRDEVLLYALIAQAKRQGADNYRSFKQKLEAILRDKVVLAMRQVSPAEMVEIYDANRGLFESTKSLRPRELYGQPTAKDAKAKVVAQDIEHFLNGAAVESFLAQPLLSARWTRADLEREVNQLKERELSRLPDEIARTSVYGKERSVQTQTQQETDAQTDKNTNVNVNVNVEVEAAAELHRSLRELIDQLPPPLEVTWPPQGLLASNYFSQQRDLALGLSRVFHGELAAYGQLFDARLLCSANLCPLDPASIKESENNILWDFSNPTKDIEIAFGSMAASPILHGIRNLFDTTMHHFYQPTLLHFLWIAVLSKLSTAGVRYSLGLLFPNVPIPYLPFSTLQRDCNQLLVIENKASAERQVLLLDASDEKQFRQLLIDASHNPKLEQQLAEDHRIPLDSSTNRLALYDLYTGLYLQSDGDEPISPAHLAGDADFQRLIVQAKFLKGEVKYSIAELHHLESWLLATDYAKLKKLFIETILPWSVITDEQYNQSRLAKLFAKLDKQAL